jgi:hypothetical protein
MKRIYFEHVGKISADSHLNVARENLFPLNGIAT